MVCIDGRIREITGILGIVDEAKVVSARSAGAEVAGEEGLSKVGSRIIEESELLLRLHSVDGAEGESQEAVSIASCERRTQLASKLNRLIGDDDTADVNLIRPNLARGATSVPIGDRPSRPRDRPEGRRLIRVKARMTPLSSSGQAGGEDPTGLDVSLCLELEKTNRSVRVIGDVQIGRTGVKVEAQSLTTYGDWAEVLDIVGCGYGWLRA